jgi:hypothetical protein
MKYVAVEPFILDICYTGTNYTEVFVAETWLILVSVTVEQLM